MTTQGKVIIRKLPTGVPGLDEIKHDKDTEELEMGGVVLVAHLLGLLATFIGESLTLRLARDAWPDAISEPEA